MNLDHLHRQYADLRAEMISAEQAMRSFGFTSGFTFGPTFGTGVWVDEPDLGPSEEELAYVYESLGAKPPKPKRVQVSKVDGEGNCAHAQKVSMGPQLMRCTDCYKVMPAPASQRRRRKR